MNKIRVPGLVVWGACTSGDAWMLGRTRRVLQYCMRIFETDHKPMLFCPLCGCDSQIDPLDRLWIPKMGATEFNIFCNLMAPRDILATGAEYALAVHEDGFPINPLLWSDEFLNYDYIGAPWHRDQCGAWPKGNGWDGELCVGNGGFCLQSARMMDLCLQMPITPDIDTTCSDVYVCRLQRGFFERNGMKFAPPDVALRFSTEQTNQDTPSFGFHGRTVAKEKYRIGWELIDSTEK